MKRLTALTAALALAACGDTGVEPEGQDVGPSFAAVAADMNDRLSAEDMDLELYMAEYITSADSEEMGRTVFFNDRGNGRTGTHFVEGDVRRSWNPTQGITIAIDGVEGATASGLSQADTDGAINAATATWEGVRCSNLPQFNLGSSPFDIGFVQFLRGEGGSPFVFADLTHAGWLPGAFFDGLAPGGSNFILGVTFTFVWTDGGVPTDIDNNGQADAAIREIYYNDNFFWSIGGAGIDVETVALHEAGHGLSQAHFGSAFRTPNGMLHFSPRAVMNAAYSGVQTRITATDNSGHCTNWGEWGNSSKK